MHDNLVEESSSKTSPSAIDLFSAEKNDIKNYHFIFVLDESGSMSRDWHSVVNAFQEFVKVRQSSCQGTADDIVSVVTFDDSARIRISGCHITSVDISAVNSYKGGGTSFASGLSIADNLIASYPGRAPMLLFMSDGGSGDGDAEMASIHSKYHALALQVDGTTKLFETLTFLASPVF